MQQTISELLRQGANDQAAEQARQWVATQPDDPQAHRWMAVARRQLGDVDGALDSIGRALSLAPEDAALHQLHGMLLLSTSDMQAAETALRQASGLDPNQIGAWLLQGQLALARADLDEARRLVRLASRVEAEHPYVAMLEAMIALQGGEPAAALASAAQALQRAPDDPQVLQTAAFAYQANGHLAFAEQAFRRVQQAMPGQPATPIMLARVLAAQGRQDEAAQALAPLLDDPARATPALQKMAGGLYMAAGQPEQALPHLRAALAGMPGDPEVLRALLGAWGTLGQVEDARAALEAALATSPGEDALWEARLAVEQDPADHLQVLQRWMVACPHSAFALERLLLAQDAAGDAAAAADAADRLLALEPANTTARLHMLHALTQRDPALAVDQLEQWLAAASDARERRFLLGMLGLSRDRAGHYPQAVEAWQGMHAELAPSLAPLPPHSAPRTDWPELAVRPEDPPLILFLWGAPGSGVDRLAWVMRHAGEPFRDDRFGPNPPRDGLQAFSIVAGLADGSIDPARLAEQWRQALPRRGLGQDCFDWLPWWDNILLTVLRPHLREAMLVLAIRDPRDTLLEWLAFADSPFVLPDPQQAADWLAVTLNQVAALHEQQWFPNRVIRTDAIGHDPAAATIQVNQALQASCPVPPTIGPPRLPAGHWRRYAQALAGPFATLAPVAARLGYPLE